MINGLLEHKNYPVWAFLGVPENRLDLFSFILFLGYMIVKINISLPVWADLIVALIYFLMFVIFKVHTQTEKLTDSLKHTASFFIFFVGWYAIEMLK